MRELHKKLTEARNLVKQDRWLPASPEKLKANFDELEEEFGVETTLKEDQTEVLMKALTEVTPQDYIGKYPPETSYEEAVRDKDMFVFRWKSPFFRNREMYLKFCISGTDEKSRRVFPLSIHPNRPQKNGS